MRGATARQEGGGQASAGTLTLFTLLTPHSLYHHLRLYTAPHPLTAPRRKQQEDLAKDLGFGGK